MKKTIYLIMCIIGAVLLFGSLGAVDIELITIFEGIWQIAWAAVLILVGLAGNQLEVDREINIIHHGWYTIQEEGGR